MAAVLNLADRRQPEEVRVSPEAIRDFLDLNIRYAPDGYFFSSRAFYHDRRKQIPFLVNGLKFRPAEEGLDGIVRQIVRDATAAARAPEPVVYAPPTALFSNKKRATEATLACAPVLAIECDARPRASAGQMQGIVGLATCIVASGGEWADPDTGEVEPKVHVYWRLCEPAIDAEGFGKVKRCRRLMAALVGSDTTAVPAVHPLRMPGSLHTKDPTRPRLCTIAERNPDAEIDLDEALICLEDAARLAGIDCDDGARTTNPDALADCDDDLAALAQTIPNDPLPADASAEDKARDLSTRWERFNRIGMAFWAASGGSGAGLDAFTAWATKRKDCPDAADEAAARWRHYQTSPPTKLSVGTLIHEARRAVPGFRLPSWQRRAAPGDDEFPQGDPGDDADGEPEREPSDELLGPGLAAVRDLNRTMFVVATGGGTSIASTVHDGEMSRERLVFSKAGDVKLMYANRRYLFGWSQSGREIWKDLGTGWIEHPERRTYQRLALIPNGPVPADTFNLWRGFGVEPRPGMWSTIRHHLLTVICSGNDAHLDYLVKWMARCVQHPEKQAEVAIVMRGLKGTGKGLAAQIMERLFANHNLHITHSRHLTGNFNAHLVDALFLFLDEALWAGDRAGEGTLKAVITERSLMIEPKHVNPFPVPNRLKIMIASNEDWVIPASAEERRYFVLDVSDCRKGDRDYFVELAATIEGPELQGFLYHLLHLDLSGFNFRNPPHTEGLNKQKLVSGDSFAKFWYDCLCNGVIVRSGEQEWPKEIQIDLLYAAYLDYAKDHGDRYQLTNNKMAERLGKLMPNGNLRRRRPRTADGDYRPRLYVLPPLDEARGSFVTAMNMDVAGHVWPKDEA